LKKNLIIVALALAASTPALALMEYEYAPPVSGSLGGVTLGDIGSLGSYGSAIGYTELPRVTVICGAMCRAQGTTIFHPNGRDKIFVGGSGPSAIPPSDRNADGTPTTPEQKEEQKKKCLANCAIQDTVNKNNCSISNAQFAAKMATTPIWTAAGGAIIGGLVFKAPGAAGGFIGGGALGTFGSDTTVKNQLSFCLAMAGRDNNNCITKTCGAFLVPLALLRRRRDTA
jgi:hypothetical protein